MEDETLKLIQDLKDDVEVSLDDLEFIKSQIDSGELENLFEIVTLLNTKIDTIKLEKGDKGDKGEDGKDGIDGKDGLDGLDGADGKDGVDGLDGSSDTPEDIAVKLNTLENAIDKKVIKGLDYASQEDIDRAISILDQRTQYLINSNRTSTASTTWGSITGTLSNQTDLQTALDKNKLIAEYHGTTTVTMTTGGTLYNLQSVLIPANTFVTGDSVLIRTICGKNVSGSTARRITVNVATSISTGGSQIATFNSASSGSRYILAVERITDIVPTGIRTFEPTVSALTDISNTASATGTDVYPTVAIDWTVDQYINILGSSASANSDMDIYHIEIWRYRI